MWSAEKRAEGLEYMHPKPSSHSGRIGRQPFLYRIGEELPVIQTGSSADRIAVHKERCRQFLRLIHPKVEDTIVREKGA